LPTKRSTSSIPGEVKRYSFGALSLTALRKALFSSRKPRSAPICDSRCTTSS